MAGSIKWLVLLAVVINGAAFYWFGTERQQRDVRIRPQSAEEPRDREQEGIWLALLGESGMTIQSTSPSVQLSSHEYMDDQQRPSRRRRSAEVQSEDGECWSVGPFNALDVANRFLGEWGAVGVSIRPGPLAASKKGEKPRIWVFLFAPVTAGGLEAQLRELRAKRIDHFVFSDGVLKGNISLGLYIRKEDAEKWRNNLVAQGYRAEIYDASNGDAFWVEFPVHERKRAAQSVSDADSVARTGLQMERISCSAGLAR
jgi:hypothetical protein